MNQISLSRYLARLQHGWIQRSSPVSPALPAPFIVGAPRSGTTLLRLMIDAHPDVAIPYETHFLAALVAAFARRSNDGDAASRIFLSLTSPGTISTSTRLNFARRSSGWCRSRSAMRCACSIACTRRAFGKTRWGDKTPHYGTIAPAISALLPEAHFVHLIRDGRDVAVSKRDLWFGPGKEIGAQAEDWVSIVETTRRLGAQCPHYLEVHFEALVRAPEETLRQVCDFLQLTFDPAMLRYHERAAERLAELNGWTEPGVSKEQFRLLHANTSSKPRARSHRTLASRNQRARGRGI